MATQWHAPAPNVLPLFDPPRKMSYRAAVAHCIRQIKASNGLSNPKLADLLDCSDETISNAENENTDLNAVTLLRIGYQFGLEAIQPVLDLATRRHIEPRTVADRFNDIASEMEALRKIVEGA